MHIHNSLKFKGFLYSFHREDDTPLHLSKVADTLK